VAVEYLVGLGHQLGLGEWLFHQHHVGVEPALGGQDGLGVAGHEQHFDPGLDHPHSFRHLLAQHQRHDDVGDEQMDLAWIVAGHVQGLRAVGRGDHLVAVTGEDPFRHLTQGHLVLHDQHRLPPWRPLVGHRLGLRECYLGGDWQRDGEGRARARLGVDPDTPAGLGDDPVDGGQAQAGSCSFPFGREERLEGMLDDLGGHAGTAVADPKPHVPPAPGLRAPGDGVSVDGDVAGIDHQGPAARHRVPGIHREIHQHLLQLARVGQHRP
jgi:hypothetical protein